MNRSTLRIQLAIVGAVVFCTAVFCPAASLAAPVKSWDQARVTGIAEQLVESVDDLYRNEYKAPAESYVPEMGASDGLHGFMDTLRRLQHETRHLADSLKKGAGAKATHGSVNQVAQLNRDLAEYGGKMEFVNPVNDEFAKFEGLIRQLAAYYEG